MKYYDITPAISADLAVFPGDEPFCRKVSLDFKSGQNLLLSSIKSTLHIGAHADGSNHYHVEGVGVDKRDLNLFFGPAQVITVTTRKGERINVKDLNGVPLKCPRLLLKTSSFVNPEQWNSDFCSLSPELVHYLADQNIKMIGIDTPSVDPETSKKLESHQAIFARSLAILEGLWLEEVHDGIYFLSALPLKIKDGDSGPVRAALWDLNVLTDYLKSL